MKILVVFTASWAISVYYAYQRTWKPFNPILGETYEMVNHGGITFIAEQVNCLQLLTFLPFLISLFFWLLKFHMCTCMPLIYRSFYTVSPCMCGGLGMGLGNSFFNFPCWLVLAV